MSAAELYRRTGIQFLPFTTIHQLSANRRHAQFAAARSYVMIPDLLGYWLSGVVTTELTNASTTGLLDAQSQAWASDLLVELGLPAAIFGEPRRPGEPIGPLRAGVRTETGLGSMTGSVLVGSHGTVSAVVGVPAGGDRFAYIACGTWSFVGLRRFAPRMSATPARPPGS